MGMGLLIYLGVFLLGESASLFIRRQLMEEVNERLPENEKFGWSTWPPWKSAWSDGDKFRLWRAHRQFFPGSRLRMCYAAALVLTVAWMFIGPSLCW
jgi:hypothetical protein